MRTLLVVLLILRIACAANAQTVLYGKAVRILDGDTFEILVKKNTYKVRLTDIDAPEKKQDFGNAAKQQLAQYIFGNEVKVEYDKLDRNGRILGHVYSGAKYINLLMVETGFAWHFKKYSSEQRFSLAEQQAKKYKTGLWSQKNPVAPWDFRTQSRKR